MKKYEYKWIQVPVDPNMLQAMAMGMLEGGQLGTVNDMIKNTLEEEAADGWRVLPPLMLPVIWLEKETTVRKKNG